MPLTFDPNPVPAGTTEVTVSSGMVMRFSNDQARLVVVDATGTVFDGMVELRADPANPADPGRKRFTLPAALRRDVPLTATLTATVELRTVVMNPVRMPDTGAFAINVEVGPPDPPDPDLTDALRRRLDGLRIELPLPDRRVLARLPLPALAPVLVFDDSGGTTRSLEDALLPLADLLPRRSPATLRVEWSIVDAAGGEVASAAVGIGAGTGHSAPRVRLTPTPTRAWDPLTGEVPPDDQMGRIKAVVVAEIPGVVPPQRREVTSSVQIPLVLPVPTVLALFRTPNMRQAFAGDEVRPGSPLFHPGESRGEDGAMAIVVPSYPPDLATPFNRESTRTAQLGTVLSAVGLSALGLAPLPPPSLPSGEQVPGGLDGLGDVGIHLRLLSESVMAPLPGGGSMPAGLGRAGELGSQLGASLGHLLGLLDGVRVIATATTELIGRSVARDAPRIDSYIRQLPGPSERQAGSVRGANIPFIRHRDVFVGTDVNIEDEVEAGILIGPPGATAQLFVRHGMNAESGRATLETGAGYCSLVPDFNNVGPAVNAPGGQQGWFPVNRRPSGTTGASYGRVVVNETLRSDRTTAPPRVDPSLARVVSSWLISPRPGG